MPASLSQPPASAQPLRTGLPRGILPGTALCIAVAFGALALEEVERRLCGRAWLEALVLAILLGAAVRAAWAPGPRWQPGIALSAKTLLDVAVALLGASLSLATLRGLGPGLVLGIAGLVGAALLAGFGLGRLLGLPPRLATLVACGNAICGNSAIAAVAPTIGAAGADVAAAIGFTAVLGVAVVLVLPVLSPALGLSATQAGAFAGLTVYAVPQVLAAAAPAGVGAVQLGTVVKLVRVLMLGPVLLLLSALAPRLAGRPATPLRVAGLAQVVPWFIPAFLALAGFRSAGLLPAAVLPPAAMAANLLTLVAMAALGLGVDLRSLAGASGRVVAAGMLSLLCLGGAGLMLIRLVGLA